MVLRTNGTALLRLTAVMPLDEIALAIAGLNGPDYVNNPELAYYLSLLRLVALVRLPGRGGPAA